jgi:hypothetical protein
VLQTTLRDLERSHEESVRQMEGEYESELALVKVCAIVVYVCLQ